MRRGRTSGGRKPGRKRNSGRKTYGVKDGDTSYRYPQKYALRAKNDPEEVDGIAGSSDTIEQNANTSFSPSNERTYKQMRANWSAERIRRLKERLEYHRQRAQLKGVPYQHIETEEMLNRIFHFQGRCAYCQVPGKRLQLDHLYPIGRGGGHVLENLVPACRACNLAKGCAADPLKWYKGHPCYTPYRFQKLKKAASTKQPFDCPNTPTVVHLKHDSSLLGAQSTRIKSGVEKPVTGREKSGKTDAGRRDKRRR
jgi:5-methylcytosine-specific restriction endonuclease McrA